MCGFLPNDWTPYEIAVGRRYRGKVTQCGSPVGSKDTREQKCNLRWIGCIWLGNVGKDKHQ